MQLVEHAVEEKRGHARKARRDPGVAHDEYWCVFDRDDHPYVPESIQLARNNEIEVAISNPCIELWFLLHDQPQTRSIDIKLAQSVSKKFLACEKRLTPPAHELLIKNYTTAKKHALELDQKHQGDNSPAGSNPSSGLWRLVESIRKLP